MIDGRDIWRQLLRVEEPWSVLKFEVDPVRRSYEISVGLDTAKGWFIKAPKSASPEFERIWRHVNFGDWDIVMRVVAPNGSNLSGLPWAGQAGLPFSNLLCQEIFVLLREGMTTQAVADYLRLPHEELWRFQQAFEAGRGMPPLRSAVPAQAPVDASIPPPSSDIWLGLLDGSREIDIRLLSLKLILTKLRTQLSGDSSAEMRTLTGQELHGYFVRNKRSLDYEIAQLWSAE